MAEEGKNKSTGKIKALAIFIGVVPLVLLLLIVEFWPIPVEGTQVEGKQYQWELATNIMGWEIDPTTRLLLLVLLAGALGSSIHAATSFSVYKGLDKFHMRWASWYLMRAPVGAGLAVIITLLIQGGLFTPQNVAEANPFTTLGLAALVGLFSRQALDKLSDVFDTMFAPSKEKRDKDEERKIDDSGQ